MHRPHLEGLGFLARREPLSHEDWYVLIETRRKLIEPYMRSMTLDTIEDLKLVQDYFGKSNLRKFSTRARITTTGEYTLETRCIFPGQRDAVRSSVEYDHYATLPEGYRPTFGAPRGTARTWGLTRNGSWLLIEANFFRHEVQYKYPDRFEESVDIDAVTVSETTPEAIVTSCRYKHPREIFDALGSAVRAWRQHRAHLLAEAKNLEETLDRENALLSIIPEK